MMGKPQQIASSIYFGGGGKMSLEYFF